MRVFVLLIKVRRPWGGLKVRKIATFKFVLGGKKIVADTASKHSVNVVSELELNRYEANVVSGLASYIHMMYNSISSYRFSATGNGKPFGVVAEKS